MFMPCTVKPFHLMKDTTSQQEHETTNEMIC